MSGKEWDEQTKQTGGREAPPIRRFHNDSVPLIIGWGLIAICALFCSWGTAWATSAPRPEEVAYDLYKQGDVEAGRQMYRTMLRNRLESHNRPPRWSPYDTYEDVVTWKAHQLGEPLRPLRAWMAAEAWLRVRAGGETPPEVATEIVAAVTDVLAYAETVSASGVDLETHKGRSAAQAVERQRKSLGKLVVNTLVFLRGLGEDHQRAMLFERAKQYLELPETLDQLDAQHPDLAETLRVEPPPRTPRPLPPQPQWIEVEQDHPIAVLAKNMYEAVNNGDLTALRSVLAEDYWPEDEITWAIQMKTGYRLVGIGRVRIRDVGDDEFEVKIDEITERTPQGEIEKGDDTILVRRGPDGEYRVSFAGPKRMREVGVRRVGE